MTTSAVSVIVSATRFSGEHACATAAATDSDDPSRTAVDSADVIDDGPGARDFLHCFVTSCFL